MQKIRRRTLKNIGLFSAHEKYFSDFIRYKYGKSVCRSMEFATESLAFMKKEGIDMKREDYISDETVIKRANAAVKIELEKNRALGVPAVLYDRKNQIIYRENDDGTKTEVGRRIRKGRYSERVSKKS